MAKISNYPAGGSVQATDQFIAARAGANVSILGSAVGGGALSAINVYTANDTWAKPAGLVYVIVEVVGGGGGGGGVTAASGQAASANGGGGGEYAKKFLLAADLGATEAVTVGAGGSGGAAGANDGSDGATTSFGAHVSAGGGGGGGAQAASATVGLPGATAGGEGGTGGAGGDIHVAGGVGKWGFKIITTQTAPSIGAASHLSGEAKSANGPTTDENGNAGLAYGGGGSGARSSDDTTNRAGGDGADGVVIVYEYTA